MRGVILKPNRRHARSQSGVAGIFWDSERLQWRAQATFHGRRVHLGRFGTIEEARAAVYASARIAMSVNQGGQTDG